MKASQKWKIERILYLALIPISYWFILFFLSWKVNSQHINYSQFYSSPLNLNPAMTGLGEFGRLGVIYRNQWPNIGDGLHYVSSWIDYNFLESNFALGLNFSKENQNQIM